MNSVNLLQNYKENFDYSECGVILKNYTALIREYLKNCYENFMITNELYYIFVIKRGLDTIKHCFKMLLMYSKNIEIVIYSCKKALCYYIEFIGQIGEDSNSYLQLNSKDAALFVYKKILFDLDEDHCKNYKLNPKDMEYLNNISELIDLYNGIILNIISIEELKDRKKEVIEYAINKGDTIVNKIISKKDYNINFSVAIFFIQNLRELIPNNREKYSEVCFNFVKKLTKVSISTNKISEKLFRCNNENIISDTTPLKFVNWIFN